MKLTSWAKEQGISYRTALNWFQAGTLPVSARGLLTGTILVDPQPVFGEPCPTCGRPVPAPVNPS